MNTDTLLSDKDRQIADLIRDRELMCGVINRQRARLKQIGDDLEKIVVPAGNEDAGVVLLSSEAPTSPVPGSSARSFDLEFFSPLGEALVGIHRLARVKDLDEWPTPGGTGPVTQEWTHALPMMQQSVLLAAVRGPDGLPKYGCVKMLLRWFRRCVLVSAIDGEVLTDPFNPNGGSFTGPSLQLDGADARNRWEVGMCKLADEYLRMLDALPHHFQLHFMHAVEIVGYKHPDARTRGWWCKLYLRLVKDMHLYPESMEEMDERLGDSLAGWLRHADKATVA